MRINTHTYENSDKTLSVNISIGQLTAGSILSGKVILITGATKGIGYALANACIAQGARVIVTGRNLDKTALISNRLGPNCKALLIDMRNTPEFERKLEDATQFFGNIDCLVNNAGISLHEGDFVNVTEESWDAQLDTNLKGPFFLTQAWLRYYRKRKMTTGHILMMASDTSGMGSSIPYGLSKAGIASLTHGLAKKLIVEGIRVNAIAPGTTLTPMTDDFTHGEICRETTIGKRALFPEEIAQIGVFLLSDLSTCVSGNIFGCSEGNICFDNVNREQETNP